jgi:trimeric autotransporter adhesin
MRLAFTSPRQFVARLLLLIAATGAPAAAQVLQLAPMVSVYSGKTGTSGSGLVQEMVDLTGIKRPDLLIPKALLPIPGLPVLGGDQNFRIAVSAPQPNALTVRYTVSGSATSGTDYTALSGSIVIPAGASSVVLPVTILDDDATERDETLEITLISGAGYALDRQPSGRRAELIIVDNDQKIQTRTFQPQAAEPGGRRGGVVVERLGTLRGELKVGLRYTGTATRGVDYVALPDTAVLSAGQGSVLLDVIPLPDAAVEGLETVGIAVGLLGTPSQVSIVDATITLTPSLSSLTEVAGNQANFVFTRTGDVTQAATVGYTVGGTAINGTDYDLIPSQVVFAAGSATAMVPVVIRADNASEGAETITLTVASSPSIAAGSPNSATLVIADNIAPSVVAMALTAQSVVGGTVVTGTVTLNGPAPEGGLLVTVSSSSASATLASTSLTVPVGQSTATFPIATAPVEAATVSTITAATAVGSPITRSLTITVPVLSTLSFNTAEVTPKAASDASSLTGQVTLTGAAPAGGITFALTSNAPTAATVPASVTVAANQTSATFPITVIPVLASTAVTISASRGAELRSRQVQVRAPRFSSFSLAPTSVVGGDNPTTNSLLGTFAFDGPVAAAGVTLSASSSSGNLTIFPASRFFAGGTTSGQISVAARPVATTTPVTVTISAGEANISASANIVPPSPASIIVPSTSNPGGVNSNITLELNGRAPTGGVVVPLRSNSAVAFPCEFTIGVAGAIALSSTTVSGGELRKQFLVCTTPVNVPTLATITAGEGTSAVSADFRVIPPIAATGLVFPFSTITGGNQDMSATLTISEPASIGGTSIRLRSSDPVLRLRVGQFGNAEQELTVTVPAGATSTGFLVVTKAVSADATITVSAGPVSQTITVLAPKLEAVGSGDLPGVVSLPGGTSRTFSVRLSSLAPQGGLGVNLSSSNPVLTVPSIVTIPVANNLVSFTVSAATTPVDVDATITATANGVSKTASVRVTGPLTVSALTVPASSVFAGRSSTGTITLSGVAPTGGAAVALSSSNSAVQVPASVTVAAGQSTVSFPITTSVVVGNSSVTAQLTATAGGVSRSTNLSVLPISLGSIGGPASMVGGTSMTLTIQLNQVAPAGGVLVNLSSSNPALPVPSSVTVPEGESRVLVPVVSTPVPVSDNDVALRASLGELTRVKYVSLLAPSLSSFTLNPISVKGGASVSGTIGIEGIAPVDGFVLTVTTDLPGVVSVPSTVTVAPGLTGATFTVVTGTVATTKVASITVSIGSARMTRTLTISP